MTDTLVSSQRRKAREAVLREVVGEVASRPSFPSLAAPINATQGGQAVPVEEAVIDTPAKARFAAHETGDNGYLDNNDDRPIGASENSS